MNVFFHEKGAAALVRLERLLLRAKAISEKNRLYHLGRRVTNRLGNIRKIKAVRKDVNVGLEKRQLDEVLTGMTRLEVMRVTSPHLAGVFVAEQLSTKEGLVRLGEAASRIAPLFPNGILLTYFRAVALAKNNNIDEAHKLVSAEIAESRKPRWRKQYSPHIANERTVALLKIWRVIDGIAREKMCWLTQPADGKPNYDALSFLSSGKLDAGEKFDIQMALHFNEPLLQGKHVEKYLLACEQIFDKAHKLTDKLKIIFAIRRPGARRMREYHAVYEVANKYYGKIRPDWQHLLHPLDARNAHSQKFEMAERPKTARRMAEQIRAVLTVARALGRDEDVALLQNSLIELVRSPNGGDAVWVAAFALAETDPVGNYQVSKELVLSSKAMPKTNSDMKNFLNWASLTQEYQRAFDFFSGQSLRLKQSAAGLIFANILQRMGRFEEASETVRGVQAAMLSRSYNLCPHTSWAAVRRAGELKFAAETAEIYSKVPQPHSPKGVVFILPRTLEQMRRTPLVVMMELKRMGWAVIPLVEGLLPLEKTGTGAIDRYLGCMTLNRQLTHQFRDDFDAIEEFEFDVEKGLMSWQGIDLSYTLWEEAAINRRVYNVDYTCPALKISLGNLALWAKSAATVLNDIHKSADDIGVPVGFQIQLISRLPDALFRFYCEQFGDPEQFFCVHAANGYQNYFTNFKTDISTKCAIRNMTRHPKTRSGAFPVPTEFEAYYQSNKHELQHMLAESESVTKTQRSTGGRKELPAAAKQALKRINEWREKGGKVACAFGRVICDSGVPYDGGPAHSDLKDWINHTIESARNSNTLLLIKLHPHEFKEEIASFLNEYFTDLIEVDLPDNVIILGHRWFDIHQLREIVDLGLIYNSITSVELGSLGIPSVLCSHFAPVDFPVGHIQPKNKRHYRQLIRFETEASVANDLKERSACWIHYINSEKVNVDYRYHARQITNLEVYPSWWFHEDIESYLADGDPKVSELARRAIS